MTPTREIITWRKRADDTRVAALRAAQETR
ncbi:hypothetical protein BJ973_006085 [Actinoplanes tereljensis]